jgi:hypothetical protein
MIRDRRYKKIDSNFVLKPVSLDVERSLELPIDLSIIIVNWNSKEYLIKCLVSIENEIKDLTKEIIIIDNNSSDDSVEMVKQSFPEVYLILNKENQGFAKANNSGIRASKGKYICLINSDVIVLKECLPKLFAFMENHKNVGLITPKMLDSDGKTGQAMMLFPTLRNTLTRALALDSLFPKSHICSSFIMSSYDYNKTTAAEVLLGFFWMIRREAFEDVGLLDERFFIYAEDIDLCKRFYEKGWQNVYYAEAQVIHFGGASSSLQPIRFYLEMLRANMSYFKKHFGRKSILLYRLILLLHHVIRLYVYVCKYICKYIMLKYHDSEAYFKIYRNFYAIIWLIMPYLLLNREV